MNEVSHLTYGQFFIHSEAKFCEVSCSSTLLPQLKHCILLYKDDYTTIETLLQLLSKQEKEKMGQLSKKTHALKLAIANQIFNKDLTIGDVRSILHNYSEKILKFELVVSVNSSLGLECSIITEQIKKHPLYKQISSKENKIEICIELPQLRKVYYYQMNASEPLENEIRQFLRENRQERWTWDIGLYTVKCKKCRKLIERLNQPTYKHFLYHFTIQINFKQIKNVNQNDQQDSVEILIKKSDIDDRILLRVPYSQAKKKKVRSILQCCDEINQFYNYGLKIGEKILKPHEYLSAVNHLGARKNGTVDAFLVEQSQIFYSLSSRFQKEFDLTQIIQVSASNQRKEILNKITNKRQQRMRQQKNIFLKNKKFLDPILGYTGQFFFAFLNQYLRDTVLGWFKEQQYDNIYFKCAFALIKSLHYLNNYIGTTYRGLDFRYQNVQKGQILCFKSFTSTSQLQKRALKFGTKTFFTIHCLTGKSIRKYSFFPQQDQVLMMPFSYFQVLNVESNDNSVLIQIQQIPIPRRINNNILIWVDDNPKEGSKIYQSLCMQYPNLKTDIIQLLSNDRLKQWISKFNYLIGFAKKISVITDMKRGEKYDEGIETIKISQKYIKDANIMVYINRKQQTTQLIQSRGLSISQKLIIGNQKDEVVKFIQEKVLDPEQLEDNLCQLI